MQTLEGDEYYTEDIVSCVVKEYETQRTIGKCLGIERAQGIHDRWWIEIEGNEIAVPSTKRYIEKVDLDSRILWLKNLKDLL